jgi:hypothetical protein
MGAWRFITHIDRVPDAIDVTQAARLAKRDRATVRRWINEGLVIRGKRVRVPSYKVGHHRWLSHGDLMEFLAMRRADEIFRSRGTRQLEIPISK